MGAIGEFDDVGQRCFVVNADLNARGEWSVFDRTQNVKKRHDQDNPLTKKDAGLMPGAKFVQYSNAIQNRFCVAQIT